MRILYYKGEEETPMTPEPESDETTLEFECGKIVNVDQDDGIVTIYTERGHFYLTLTQEELSLLK